MCAFTPGCGEEWTMDRLTWERPVLTQITHAGEADGGNNVSTFEGGTRVPSG